MFLDLLRVHEEIDVFDNYNVGAEIETLDVDLKFRQVSKRKKFSWSVSLLLLEKEIKFTFGAVL